MTVTLLLGDCLDVLKTLEPNSVDSIVTDPPYELRFMGHSWDKSGIAFDVGMWQTVLRVLKHGGYLLAFGGTKTFHRMACAIEDAGFEMRDCLSWLYGSGMPKSPTTLKPAWEPVIMARKKGVKISECPRVNIDDTRTLEGRWPANVLLDEWASSALDAQSGILGRKDERPHKLNVGKKTRNAYGGFPNSAGSISSTYGDLGGASRFFFCAKASRSDRNEGLGDDGNTHPTVKPTALMRYLCRLITPPGGVVLDPFMGSGSTGKGAVLEGFSFVGIEAEPEYYAIAQARIDAAEAQAQPRLEFAAS